MEKLIETIRNAVADGASAEVKQAGAEACRSILAALEAVPGQPIGSGPSTPGPLRGPLPKASEGERVGSGPVALPVLAQPATNPLAGLAGVDIGQVLELLIGRLKGAAAVKPAAEEPAPAQALHETRIELRIPFVEVGSTRKARGG